MKSLDVTGPSKQKRRVKGGFACAVEALEGRYAFRARRPSRGYATHGTEESAAKRSDGEGKSGKESR